MQKGDERFGNWEMGRMSNGVRFLEGDEMWMR